MHKKRTPNRGIHKDKNLSATQKLISCIQEEEWKRLNNGGQMQREHLRADNQLKNQEGMGESKDT